MSVVKAPGLTWELQPKLQILNAREVGGIPGVGVKSVDIWRNIGGEGGQLALH